MIQPSDAVNNLSAISYRHIIKTALPLIAANALLPLQGLIDTAIMGHLDNVSYLSALGLATSIFAVLYASLNFLQYATSGLSAQALGAQDYPRIMRILWRALFVASAIAAILFVGRRPIAAGAQWYFQSSAQTKTYMAQYIHIRLFGALAELGIFCCIGWFAGQSLGKYLLIQQAALTISNIIFSLIFVYGFNMTIDGVAWGTVIGNYIAIISGLLLAYQHSRRLDVSFLPPGWATIINPNELLRLLYLNSNLFVRTILLVGCFSWFQRLASGLGENYIAANVLLLWLLTLAAYLLDSIALTAEGFTGQALGANSSSQLTTVIKKTAITGSAIAIAITLIYLLFVPAYIEMMTNNPSVQNIAIKYRWWAVFLPLSGIGGYLLDGYYFGATAAKPLRNAMLIITVVTIPSSYAMTTIWGNDGIWIAVHLFLWLRVIILAFNLNKTLFNT